MSGADVIVYDLGDYALHTYIAPEKSFGDATHILETPNQLILIDTQYSMTQAREFRAYAQSLGKPIKNIIISHAHPDHYLGLDAFRGIDAQVWATAHVIAAITAKASKALEHSVAILGSDSAQSVTIPNSVINVASTTIDGLVLQFLEVERAEARHQLVINLPQLNTLIVQDLVYNQYHAYLNPWLLSWKNAIVRVRALFPKTQMVLVGHGEPATPDVFDQMLCYLEKALTQCRSCKDRCAHKDYFASTFPDYKGADIIDLYLPSLYPGK
jgi:glyoxylase-like metal-dependent hydrolase (beta-lactamase superfamily II)